MLNIVDLERRWMRYKIKSYIPHVIIAFSTLIIILLLFIFSTNHPENKQEKLVQKQTIAPKKIQTNQIQIQKVPTQKRVVAETPKSLQKPQSLYTKHIQEPSRVQLSPSLDFMKKMQNSVQPYYKTENTNTPQPYKEKSKKVTKPIVHTKPIKQKVSTITVTEIEPKKISIKRQNTQNDIYEIIQRFQKNNNPALSLFVAKKYYELGDYGQAYNYALITNDINKNIESSWLIFARSLVKLGKRKQAVQTLQKYVSQSHSGNAKILLDEIRSGKFK